MVSEATSRAARAPQLDKYDVREEIGRGGMATVYRALDNRLGREVAVKVIHPHLRDSAEVASRFQTEAQAVAKLRHPNIVEVYDVSASDEPEQYLVVELVRGTTLRRLLQESGALPPEVAGAVCVQLLEALSHAHASSVIHRDIKPENVLVEYQPEPGGGGAQDPGDAPQERGRASVGIKLTDFGIAKLLDAQGITSTGQVLGSPAHMAPEQIEGGEVDARSDVFGMGVLLYECVVGHLPFEGANPAQVLRGVLEGRYPPAQVERAAVGSRWSALIDRALSHDRSARFSSAQAMRDAVVAELERLGFWPSDRELEAWLDDPAAYLASYRPRVVERLCALGDQARKRRDALAAASDYNRALANAPGDPGLLRIVTKMHRAQVWSRAVLRAGAGVLMVGAAWLLRMYAIQGQTAGGAPPPSRERIAESPAPPAGAGEPSPAPTDATSAAGAVQAPTGPSAARARVHDRVPVKPVERRITFDLTPPMGIEVSLDGQARRPVGTGDALAMDSEAHSLVFDCSVCVPVRVSLAAGESAQTLVVVVPVKPATLEILGSVGSAYQITEHPDFPVRAGANTVPLRSAFERVTIKQLQTGASVTVRLEAGNTIDATFPR